MEGFERYAIYYAPASGSALMRYGCGWLGRDPETGAVMAPPKTVDLTETQINDFTRSPRRYGFHGTLKPPFALSRECSIHDLDLALQALSGQLSSAKSGPLKLHRIGSFLCLVPTGDQGGIERVAGAVVRELDRFRGPQSEEQLAKRRERGLTDKQEAYLQRYGYPYVMDEFRFHLTLTDSLAREDMEVVQPVLQKLMSEVYDEDFQIRELCLFADPGANKPFQLLKRYALSGGE